MGFKHVLEALTFLKGRSWNDWRRRKTIWRLCRLSVQYTTQWWRRRGRCAGTMGWPSWSPALLWATQCPCTTVSTTRSKFTCLVILSSLDRFISWCHVSVACLVCAARGFLSRWTFWLTRLISSVRELMQWFHTCIISFRISAWGKPMSTSIATTAQGRTRTGLYCGIVHGEWPSVCTIQ